MVLGFLHHLAGLVVQAVTGSAGIGSFLRSTIASKQEAPALYEALCPD